MSPKGIPTAGAQLPATNSSRLSLLVPRFLAVGEVLSKQLSKRAWLESSRQPLLNKCLKEGHKCPAAEES